MEEQILVQYNLRAILSLDSSAGIIGIVRYFRLEYRKSDWFLMDGDGNKKSTNGTWIFVDDPFIIFDKMIFKAGQTLFKARLRP